MWYSAGTVAVTANSATVTGTGTAFSANARVGDAFRGPDGRWYAVTNIASASVISISPAYQGETATGQTYAIAPIQGYVKESADRLRQLVDQFGSQLAALQPWATSATPAAAREALGTNDAANLTAGLLNVDRIPATLTPDKAFRRSNILGTVSQSGGVPTGAIIERGSNANGEYIRWADGTQICTKILTVSLAIDIVFGSMYASAAIQLGTPAASFINTPAASPTGWDATGNSLLTFTNTAPTASNLGVIYLGRPSSQGALNRHVHVTATGRWF